MNNFTLVTGLIDLNREDWGEWGRSYETYLEYFKKVLKLKVPMIIYIEQKSVNWVWEHRPRDLYSYTKIFPIIPEELKCYRYIDKITSIMECEDFKTDRVAPDVPEANYPIYNILVNSKVSLLYKASLENTFNTKYMVWLDAGYGHGEDEEWGKTFPDNFNWNLKNISEDKFTLIQRHQICDNFKDKSFFYKSHISVFLGGFMCGSHESIKKFHDSYYEVFEENLMEGFIDQEQTNMLYTFFKSPELVHSVWGDWYDVFKLFNVNDYLIQDKLRTDCIYIINLKRKPERKEYIINHLREKVKYLKDPPKIEILEAIDGKNLNDDYLKENGIKILENYSDPYSGRNMTYGEIGCFLSHYTIWAESISRNYNRIIILEDDAELVDNFVEQYNRCIKQATKLNWDLMYLGRKEVEPDIEKIDDLLCYPGYSYWTIGYSITLKGMKKLIDSNPLENIIPVDEYLPCMYGQQTHDYMKNVWSNNESIIAISADPLLLWPKDDAFEQSETECSGIIEYKTAEDVICYCVATERTDGYERFERSARVYGIQLKTIGLGDTWNGGDMNTGAGGGHKVNLLKKILKDEKDDNIIIFSDSYDVIFSSHSFDIKSKFKKFNCNILFSAEPYCWPDSELENDYPISKNNSKYRFLNSGGFIGYAKYLKKMLNWKDIEDNDDDQLYYTNYFLKYRNDVLIKLDYECEIFQVLNGIHINEDYEILYSKGVIKNKNFNTHPCIIHGNGPINVKVQLNNIGNYLARKWNPTYGWLEQLEKPGKYIKNIFISLIINNPIPFYEKVLEGLYKLNYNKKNITLWIHMSNYSNNLYPEMKDQITDFIKKNKNEYLEVTFNIGLSDDPTVIKEMSLYNCVLKSSEYYFLINDGVILHNEDTISILISRKQNIVAPHLDKNNTMWCNFWGDIDYNGGYSESHDEKEIITRERMGLWNVSYIDTCYLLNCKLLPKLGSVFRYENEENNPDHTFCKNLRKKGIFMYLDNFEEYGKVLCCDDFINWCDENKCKLNKQISNSSGNPKPWEEEYLHPLYLKYMNEGSDLNIEEVCNDVYSFPLFSEKFCKEIIEISEQYGNWSGGTGHNEDIRLSGGYENHPTKDIHLGQLCLNDNWNNIVMKYIAPIASKVYGDYVTKGTNINFVVRYKDDEQCKLEPHHDASSYTANVSLNKKGVDYEGGGCRFIRQNFNYYQENIGYCCIHPGKLTHYHEGLPTTKGIRYILVSFIE